VSRLAYKEDDWGGVWYHNGAFMDTVCIIYERNGVAGWGTHEFISVPFELACELAAEGARQDWVEKSGGGRRLRYRIERWIRGLFK
jgi:hypothetical protein